MINPKITAKRVVNAVEREMFGLDNPGFCKACGHEQEGLRTDAENYECEACGEDQVFGAAELLMEFA